MTDVWRRAVIYGLATGSITWTLLLVVAPSWRAGGDAGPAIAAAVYLTGAELCHQIPARSFSIAGARMPVCARCTGLYAGAAIGALAAVLMPSPRPKRPRRARTLFVIAAVPTIATIVLEWSAVPVGNVARAVAALPAGAMAAWLVVTALGDAIEVAHPRTTSR